MLGIGALISSNGTSVWGSESSSCCRAGLIAMGIGGGMCIPGLTPGGRGPDGPGGGPIPIGWPLGPIGGPFGSVCAISRQ